MNLREARALGRERGWNVASWQDMPAIGETLCRSVDWIGIGTIETVEEQIEAFEALCCASDSNARQFSPFEFTAAEINGSRDPDGLWEAFDDGIRQGIHAYRRRHYPLKSLRKEERNAA